MWQHYYQPTTLANALALLRQHAGRARIVAGGTDVTVELSRGIRPTETLIDITRIPDMRYVDSDGDPIRLGALATHNDVLASPGCRAAALPLAQACLEVGAPPIRTRATVAGNLVTASPANDTITPLLALGAELALASADGERVVPLAAFYHGVRRTELRPDEVLREIRFPALGANQRGIFLKLGLRRAQAIAVINVAVVVTFDIPNGRSSIADGEEAIFNPQSAVIGEARIALGSVAPTVVRAPEAEAFLAGRALTPEVCAEAGRLARAAARPIDDVRGSAAYRLAAIGNLVNEALRRIAAGRERERWPERVVLLETGRAPTTGHRPPATAQDEQARAPASAVHPPSLDAVETRINGRAYTLTGAHRKTLLDALREDAGLTGTKEGCAEGECGACAIWLGGQAVMACLTPAAQAHGTEVVTIEGLAGAGRREDTRPTIRQAPPSTASRPPPEALHPLQAAFIRHGAVQCGYCIPGMLMAGAKLLEEVGQPTLAEAQAALSGNICRCTGYRKILDAVLAAAAANPNEQA